MRIYPAHYQTNVQPAIIAVRRVSFEFENNLHRLLILRFILSYFSPLTRRTTIITILTNWNIRGARVQIAAGNEGRRRFRFGRNFFLLHRDSGFEGVRWLI